MLDTHDLDVDGVEIVILIEWNRKTKYIHYIVTLLIDPVSELSQHSNWYCIIVLEASSRLCLFTKSWLSRGREDKILTLPPLGLDQDSNPVLASPSQHHSVRRDLRVILPSILSFQCLLISSGFTAASSGVSSVMAFRSSSDILSCTTSNNCADCRFSFLFSKFTWKTTAKCQDQDQDRYSDSIYKDYHTFLWHFLWCWTEAAAVLRNFVNTSRICLGKLEELDIYAVGRWFPLGTPVSSTYKIFQIDLDIKSSACIQ